MQLLSCRLSLGSPVRAALRDHDDVLRARRTAWKTRGNGWPSTERTAGRASRRRFRMQRRRRPQNEPPATPTAAAELDVAVDLERVIEERERDLELAARLGRQLLDENQELQQRNQFLEESLTARNDAIQQLQFQLQRRSDLLEAYAEYDEQLNGGPADGGHSSRAVGELQARVQQLEAENGELKSETTRLRNAVEQNEHQQEGRVKDYLSQLERANLKVRFLSKRSEFTRFAVQIARLQSQIGERTRECEKQNEEIQRLLREISTRKQKEKAMSKENDDLQLELNAAVRNHEELSAEILALQERYGEREAGPSSELLRLDLGALNDDAASSSSPAHVDYDLPSQVIVDAVRRRRTSGRGLLPTVDELPIDGPKEDERQVRDVCCSPIRVDSPREVPPEEPTPRAPTASTFFPYSGATSSFAPNTTASEAASSSSAPTSDEEEETPKSADSLSNYVGPSLGQPGVLGTRDLEYSLKKLNIQKQRRRHSDLRPAVLLAVGLRRASSVPSVASSSEMTAIERPLDVRKNEPPLEIRRSNASTKPFANVEAWDAQQRRCVPVKQNESSRRISWLPWHLMLAFWRLLTGRPLWIGPPALKSGEPAAIRPLALNYLPMPYV
ncbi:HAP1 N-terminal domain-containing protein [Aphelenchoides fujianensis]|nr:HAP1 N-terminal domain-containing protein [Aphelenchoides fujianensis]